MPQVNMYRYLYETPECLNKILETSARTMDDTAAQIRRHNPKKLIIIGSGTSYYSGLAVQPLLEGLLKIPVSVEYPIPFRDRAKDAGSDTLVIGISQSGSSASTISGLDFARENGAETLAITGEMDSPIIGHAAAVLDMQCGEEKASAKTKGYHCTLLSLILTGLSLARVQSLVSVQECSALLQRIRETVQRMPQILQGAEAFFQQHQSELIKARQMMVIGYGQHTATAFEGALKLLETQRYLVCGYELEEFMHGIYNAVGEESYLFYLAAPGVYRERIGTLAQYLSKKTPHGYLIAPQDFGAKGSLPLPFIDDPLFSIFEYILPLELLSCLLAVSRGINPDIASDPAFHRHMQSKL